MDPFNIKASLKALAASKRQEPSSYQPPQEEADPIQKLGSRIQKDIVKEAPPGLLERAGGTALSGLATVGNLLDVPGSMVRDVATWLPGGPKPANPFDQLVSPFTHHNRTTGRDLLRGYGLAGKEDTMGNFTTGLGAEIALDPLTYLTFGASALTRGGRAAKALNMMDDAPEIASRLLNRRAGKREARHVVTPRMLLDNPRINAETRARLQQRMTEMGVTEKDMDRQLGGLAKINLPFSNKPFKFGGKPFTFWGLTDEEGIIGAGKARGRGPDPLPPVRDPGDAGPPSGGALGGDGPDIPPTEGPAPDLADMPDSPVPSVDPVVPEVPPSAGPAAGTPVVQPPPVTPAPTIGANSFIQPIDENNYGVMAEIPDSQSRARATLTYAGEADETPMLFIDQLQKQPGSPKGSGRALINSMVEKVKDRNPMGVAGNFDSHDQLGAFASVFGKDNIRFLDRTTGQPVDIPFAEANKTPSKYTAVHYFIEPPKAAAKVETPQYKPEEIEASRQLGYEIEDIPRSYNEMAADIKSNPVRLLAAESAVGNLIDMVSHEGTPLIQALDQLEWNVDLEFDRLGFGKPSPAEIEYARRGLSIIERPLNINDLIEYGKARVADAGKGKAQSEAERIFKKYGSFDMDEGAYYRAVLGEVPKPKQQKRLIDEAAIDPTLPSHEVLMRTDPALYQKWKNGEVEELSRYTNSPEHDDIYFQWTDAGLEHPWPSLVKGDEKVWDQFRHIPQNLAPDKGWDAVANRTQQPKDIPPSALQPDLMTPEVVREAKSRARQAKVPTVYTKEDGKWKPVFQFETQQDAADYIEDMLARNPGSEYKISQLEPKPIKKERGVELKRDGWYNEPDGAGGVERRSKYKKVPYEKETGIRRGLGREARIKEDRANWAYGYAGSKPEIEATKHLLNNDAIAASRTGVPVERLAQMIDDGVSKGAFTSKEAADLKTSFAPQKTAAPTQPMTSMEAMQAEAGIKPTTPPNEIAVKTRALLQEVESKRGAGDAEVAEMLLRGDTASAIRRLETKPLDGLKIDGLMSAAKKNGILTDEQANAILAAIPPKYKGGMSALDEAKQVSDDLASKNKLESRIDQTETPEFKNWFGASKVVDDAGKPLALYHGSLSDFKEFQPANTSSYYGKGVYLTASPEDASKYASSDVSVNLDYGPKAENLAQELGISYKEAKELMEGTGGNVYKVHASLQNPLVLETKPIRFDESAMRLALAESDVAVKDVTKFIKELNAATTAKAQHDILAKNRATQSLGAYASLKNHDGLIVGGDMTPRSGGAKHVVAFRPEQIKSATGNTGDFNTASRNILESRINQTETPEFKNWFGDWKKDPANASKVVDSDGKPLVVYHGTNAADFNSFTPHKPVDAFYWNGNKLDVADYWDISEGKALDSQIHPHAINDVIHFGDAKTAFEYRLKESSKYTDNPLSNRHIADLKRLADDGVGQIERKLEQVPSGDGTWFTPDTGYSFISKAGGFDGGRVYPVYLNIKNPKFVNSSEVESAGRSYNLQKYKDEGYDGVIFANDTKDLTRNGWGGSPQIVAFYPEQIKSATGNRGTFDSASKNILEAQGGASSGAKMAPTKVDLNTLEGLPEQARPIVGDMINKIGQRLFDDVTMEIGGDAAKVVTTGDIDMDTGFIRIYNSAIQSGIVDKTTVHELWHHLSKYITPEEVRVVQKEFDDVVKANKGPLPYELSSIDEYFAHKLTDLTMKYLGREKPASVIGSVWAKALDVFEHIWDAIRQTLGYDQTKKIMYSFLDGHRADAVKLSDATMQQRLVGDVEINGNILDTQQRITDTPAFQKWFGESKVVDDAGKPMIVYHSTPAEPFTTFFTGQHFGTARSANDRLSMRGKKGHIYPVYLKIENPIRLTDPEAVDEASLLNAIINGRVPGADIGIARKHGAYKAAQAAGYDGVVYSNRLEDAGKDSYVVFEPEQIKSATANRGTFDPNSKNILESQADSVIPNRDIAGQLAQAKSAILGKNLDDIGQSILDSAVGRQMTALFDQSVLGQITKAGQEAARLAFKGYRDAVFKEREYMSHHLRTWYDLPNIREDIIMDEELGSLDEFIAAAGGDKALGAKNRMIEARKIQGGRVNDLRRLLEQPLWDEEGNWIQDAFRVEEHELPAWVGQEKVNGQIVNNPARRQQVAQMLSAWRLKTVQMLGGERNEGLLISLVNGYFPRLVSNLPGSNRSLWNPNYGKILDPTHPSAKRRKDWFVGYDDGTAVINDISVDPDLSGAHARKMVREQVSPAEIQQYANVLWERYKDRLMGGRSQLTYGELAQADPKAFAKINKLTEEIMNLDPRHVEHQIPLFSNDLFSAMELRLEHHHRSIMHARAIQHLVKQHAVSRNLIGGDGQGVTLNELLREARYDSKRARQIMEIGVRGDVALAADKNFWNQEIQPRINEAVRSYQEQRAYFLRNPDAQPGTATGLTPYTDPAGRQVQIDPTSPGMVRLTFPQFFDKKVPDVPNHEMTIEVNLSDPSASRVSWVDQVDDGEHFIGTSDPQFLNNPTNISGASEYRSRVPLYVLLDHVTVPRDVGDAITKFVQGPRTLEEVKPIVRGYDKGTNMWKMMQTGMMPFIGFHGRNFGSGQASNFYLGIQNDPRFKFNLADPTTYLNPVRSFAQPIIDAHKIATGQTIEGAASMPQFAGMNFTDEAATEALRREMYAQGITGEKQGLSAEQLTDTVGTAASQFPGIDKAKSINPLAWQWSRPAEDSTFAQRWLMPWMSKGVLADTDIFRPGQLGRDLGGYTEALNRLAPYIAMRRQGFDPKAAAGEVNRAQVDYTNLSNFNREYTRRLFPFASYTLGMTPTVFGELASRPGGGMGRTVMATTAAGQTSEQGVTPDYIRETASIPLGISEDGTRSYITGFGLPFEDPLQFAQLARGNVSGVLRELGSRMNPVPKSLIEIMTGRSLYQAGPFGGREIEDLDPTIGRILANVNDLATGEKTEKAEPFLGNPWAEYIIANAGPGRMLNTARTITDPRKWDTIPWKLALNLGTGVRVADVSPSAQDAILRERLARVMKDFGGRMYTRPYFPDYAKESWTPEEAEDAAKIDALLKLLGQRAKDRRVQ